MSEDTYKMLTAFSGMGNFMREKLEGLTFLGMQDTPTGYQGHSGDYLVVNDNERGIHFTGIEKIAADLTNYGFDAGSSSGLITSYPSVGHLPTSPATGDLAIVGCDIYIACDNGEWQKLLKDGEQQASLPDNASAPSCVVSMSDQILYNQYREEFVAENEADVFRRAYEGTSQVDIHEVCIHTVDSRNTARIDDGPNNIYKFGLFYGNSGVNITAIPKDSSTQFERWESSASQNVFGNESQPNTTLQVTGSMDVYAKFSGFTVPPQMDVSTYISNSHDISVRGNTLAVSSYNNTRVVVFKIEENGDLTLKNQFNQGANFGIAVNLSESGDKLAVSDYHKNFKRVYLYEKDANGIFVYKNFFGRGDAAFSTALSWYDEDKLMCSSYQTHDVWDYTIDQNFAATQTQEVYNNVGSLHFGNKLCALGDLAVVNSKYQVHIMNYDNATSQWEINQSESFTYLDEVDLSISNGRVLTKNYASLHLGQVQIQDENNIFVSAAAQIIVDGLVSTGFISKFQKQNNKWVNTENFIPSTPIENQSWGYNFSLNDGRLFALFYNTGKIDILNI